MKSIAYAIIGATILAMGAQLFFYYPKLPAQLASHFNGAGQPDGWTDKAPFFIGYFILQLLLLSLMIGLGKSMHLLPAHLINVPNKEVWLVEEYADQFYAMNELMLTWIAAATSTFLVFVFQLVIVANLQQQPLMSIPVWVGTVVYLGIIFGMCAIFFLRLNRGPTTDEGYTL